MGFPWLRLALWAAAIALVAAAAAGLRAHYIDLGRGEVRSAWDRQRAADVATSLALERQRNADQLIRFKNAERTASEQALLEIARVGRAAALERELGGLRDTIARLDRRAVPATCDAACAGALAGEAATARELFATCTDRYRSVASAAEELRDQVTGLQADARDARRAPAATDGARAAPLP